jgi:hypothetical protein
MMSVTVKPLMHVHEEVMSFNVNVDEKIMEWLLIKNQS